MRITVCVCAALALNGCALFDPYAPGRKAGLYDFERRYYDCPLSNTPAPVNPNNETNKGGGDNGGNGDENGEVNVGGKDAGSAEMTPNAAALKGRERLQCVLQTSQTLQAEYYRAAGFHEKARTVVGGAITFGTAYALLLGISDGIAPANRTDQIAAIGAGAAALLGASSLIINPRSRDVYIAGAQAVICPVQRAGPFTLDQKTYDRLTELVTSANGDEPPFSAEISQAESLYNLYRLDAPLPQTTVEANRQTFFLTTAGQIIDAARMANNRAVKLKYEVDVIAPKELLAALMEIDGKVAGQVSDAQPELSDIAAVQGSLAGAAARIAPGFAAGAPGVAAGAPDRAKTANDVGYTQSAAQQRLLEDLRIALQSIRTKTLEVNGLVDGVEIEIERLGSIDDCAFEPVELGFRLSKNSIVFRGGTDQSEPFQVVNGSPPFSPSIAGAPSGLAVDPIVAGREIVVRYDASEAAPGEHTLSVTETMRPSGGAQSLKVIVLGEAAPGTSTETETLNPPVDKNKREYAHDFVRLVQKTLNAGDSNLSLTIDGDFGANTQNALKAFQKRESLPASESGRLDSPTTEGTTKTLGKLVERFIAGPQKTDMEYQASREQEAAAPTEARKVAEEKLKAELGSIALCAAIQPDGALSDAERVCIVIYQFSKLIPGAKSSTFPVSGTLDNRTRAALEQES